MQHGDGTNDAGEAQMTLERQRTLQNWPVGKDRRLSLKCICEESVVVENKIGKS